MELAPHEPPAPMNCYALGRVLGISHVAVWRWLKGYAQPSRLARDRMREKNIILPLPTPRPAPRPKARRPRAKRRTP